MNKELLKKYSKQIEFFGWVAVGLILAAYALVSFEKIDSSSAVYQLMNLFGAIGVILSALDNKDWQPIALNAVWALIALAGLLLNI